jgi:hypothetical protein
MISREFLVVAALALVPAPVAAQMSPAATCASLAHAYDVCEAQIQNGIRNTMSAAARDGSNEYQLRAIERTMQSRDTCGQVKATMWNIGCP